MGFYIQTPENQNKASQLVKLHGGVQIQKPNLLSDIPADKALIVVVHNGFFDAAGLAFDQTEFETFTEPGDPRFKQYVLLDKELAYNLANYHC